MKKTWLYFTLIILTAYSCNDNSKQPHDTDIIVPKDTVVQTPAVNQNKDSLLLATGQQILQALKAKNYPAFTSHFVPQQKIRFSPYGFIDSTSDVSLSAAEFLAAIGGNKLINWGSYDGSGDPISLSVKNYVNKFIYNADFLNAENTSIDHFKGSGNSLNNLKEIYPGSRFIEYYFSGFDKKYEGMDWTCLRLVFKEMDHVFYLQAIVHDQWTI